MKSHVGDRLVIQPAQGSNRRVGVILAVAHADGSPPYRVRWLDSGRETFVFPASDAHIEAATPEAGSRCASPYG
jgi:hypothetical protein